MWLGIVLKQKLLSVKNSGQVYLHSKHHSHFASKVASAEK
jgi:hypothetical protein